MSKKPVAKLKEKKQPLAEVRKKIWLVKSQSLSLATTKNHFSKRKFLRKTFLKKLRMVSHPHYHPQRQELHQQAELEGMEQ